MFRKSPLLFIAIILFFLSGCNFGVKKDSTPTLLEVEDASKTQLLDEINRFAKVGSMRAKMDLKFEDTSFAQ